MTLRREGSLDVNKNERQPKGHARLLSVLFLTFFRIGLFTFGGGYAMIALLEKEFVEKKKWIGHEEFLDVVAIAESTPGPIAVNSATYIGYNLCGFFGALVSTLAVCIPSFVIIYIISLFFNAFLSLKYVAYAFRGIQACIVFLILSAGLKMVGKLRKNLPALLLFGATMGCLVGFSLFAVNFSSILYIVIGAVAGLFLYLVALARGRSRRRDGTGENDGEGGEDL